MLSKYEQSTTERIIHNNRSYSWLAMVDINHFLLMITMVMSVVMRYCLSWRSRCGFFTSDLMFRFGGEEFVLIFEPCKQEDINEKMQAFMDHANPLPFVKRRSVWGWPYQYDFPISVRENKALYYAKNNGRDQLHFFDDLAQSGAISPDNANQDEGDIDLF